MSLVLAIGLLVTLAVPVVAASIEENTGRATATKDKAIIIIPGFAGTALKEVASNSIAWYSPGSTGLTACTETGTSVYNIEPIASGLTQYGVGNMYYPMYSELNNTFGSIYDVLFFPYDWRMSNTDSADELEAFINNSGYDEVIFVAHSMGGLVASSYLRKSENRAKVDKLITIGTPFLGSPTMLYAMETGIFFPDGYEDYNVGFKDVINNFSSAYETLPPSRLFEDYVIKGSTTLSGFAATYSFIASRPWAKTDGSVKSMLSAGSNFHNTLLVGGQHVANLSSVDVYRIVGYGVETITHVVYDADGTFDRIIKGNYGDGTVPYLSATNNYTVKRYDNVEAAHIDLISHEDTISHTISYINGTASASASNEIEVNDRDWIVGYDNKRIAVVVDSTNSFEDLLEATVIHTTEGELVTREGNRLYVEQNDGTKKEVGTFWQAGNESIEFSMHNGEYSFTFTTGPDSIVVEYSDSGYYERVLEYDLSNASSVRLEVCDYDSKEVHCVANADANAVVYRTVELAAVELPEDQLYDYKNPNK